MITQDTHNQADFDVIGGLRSSVGGMVRSAVERIQSEQAEVRRQIVRKRQVLNQYHLEMIDGMPLQERLKSGNYRF